MRLSVGHKLFLILLLATSAVVGVTMLFVSWSFERGFVRFVEHRQQDRIDRLSLTLAGIYDRDGGWSRLAADRHRWGRLLAEGQDPGPQGDLPPRGPGPGYPPFGGPPGRGIPPPPQRRVEDLSITLKTAVGTAKAPRSPSFSRKFPRNGPHPLGEAGSFTFAAYLPLCPWRLGGSNALSRITDGPVDWPPPAPPGVEEEPVQALARRLRLLDADQRLIFGKSGEVGRLELFPIERDGETVGYLGLLPGAALHDVGEVRFFEQQNQAFLVIALVTVLLSALLAFPMARRLVTPLRDFTSGARALAAGRYSTRIRLDARDELGDLARDFNELALALERTERQRRQWVADISHELRTPLSVLRGELEALQDGVRPLSAASVDSLHADVLRLAHLVEDLYELSMSDVGALRYRKVPTEPLEVLEEDLDGMAGEFGRRRIAVELQDRLRGRAVIHADPDRLSQLFRNLLKNTLRYTDPGGRLLIGVGREGGRLTIDFQDSAPGVSVADLGHLFERFYRVEASRSRTHGGAGLGLAICRNIVEAHEGAIVARASPLGGLWVRVELQHPGNGG